MSLITGTQELAEFCERVRGAYVAVDTEFMRDKTFWPKLCLVQIAAADEARPIDPLAPEIDLSPLYELLQDAATLKVFHAARQDIEIFHHLTGRIPHPVFDTQVAAMVCGFGEQVGYDTLVNRLTDARIDKSSRVSDWAKRPLDQRQIDYALADVIHLRPVYEALQAQLDASGRAHWLDEEMAALTDPASYSYPPEEAWRRIKSRASGPRFLGILKEVAAWREREAQARDMPRQRILRDETLVDIAGAQPTTRAQLAQSRNMPRKLAQDERGAALLEAVATGLNVPRAELPRKPAKGDGGPGGGPTVDLLKVLLKQRCSEHGVAQRLVASSADLEALAGSDKADIPALRGWRYGLFGRDACRLKRGDLALAARADGDGVAVIDLADET